jgi:hypothetical protein
MKKIHISVLSALLSMGMSLASTVDAQVIYRCGTTYSQAPCLDGKVLESTDSRTAAQRAEAQRAATSERKLATDMKRDRLQQEAAIQPAGAANLGSPPAAAASTPKRERTKKSRIKVTRITGKNFNPSKSSK